VVEVEAGGGRRDGAGLAGIDSLVAGTVLVGRAARPVDVRRQRRLAQKVESIEIAPLQIQVTS